MNTIGYYLQLIIKRKYWIAGIFIITILVAFLYTLPSVKKPLYTVYSEFCINDISRRININLNRYITDQIKSNEVKNHILAKYGSHVTDNSLSNKNYNQRILVSSVNNMCISLAVMDESPENAEQIINDIMHLISEDINFLINKQYEEDMNELKYQIEIKNNQLDSLKQKIIEIDKQIIKKLNKGKFTKDLSIIYNKDFLIKQEILFKKNPDFMVTEKLIGKYINDLGFYINNYHSLLFNIHQNNKLDYFHIIKPANAESPAVYPDRVKLLIGVGFLSLVFSISLFVLVDKIGIR